MDYLKIPLITPFKFVPSTNTPGAHFDDDWTCKQYKSFERRAYYLQKWVKTDTTSIQIESTIEPQDLRVYTARKQLAKSIAWQKKFQGTGYAIYEAVVDLSDLGNDTYFLYFKADNGLGTVFEALSEPIALSTEWQGTMLIRYQHEFNDYDVMWLTGLNMAFRCEAGIMDMQPESERTAYVNQTQNVSTLWGVPFRTYKLYIGDASGVAPYVADILNRIFLCTYVSIEGKQFQKTIGAKTEVSRAKGYPLVGVSIEITESFNDAALNFTTNGVGVGMNNGGSDAGQIITAFNIKTTVFGGGATVPIIDVEKQS